ncbi:MAG: sensor domain-containing diguanylate cyclase [Candidatus Omnitrophota bacterium]
MKYFIYFIISAALLFVSYRTNAARSFAASFSAGVIIFIINARGSLYESIVFALFFNALPFIAGRFKSVFNVWKAGMRDRLEGVRRSYDEIVAKDKQQIEINLELERKLSQILSLYEVSKDMSSCLSPEDIFNVFSSALKKSFRFRASRIALLKEEDNSVGAVYKIELGRSVAKAVPDDFDKEIAAAMLEVKIDIFISSQENLSFLRRLSVIKEFDTLICIPLMAEDKIIGVLYVENIPRQHFENFVILARQFAIQFQKVVLYKKVQDIAITDSLTEVSTRRYFLERFSEEIRRAMRHKTSLSFLMLDLDHFKAKNDKFGHLVGDVILKEVAALLKTSLREIDIIGRYGGEEFGVVLAGIGRDGAMQVAERIRLSVGNAVFKAYDEVVSTTLSIGLSVFPDDGASREDLIEKADKALYKAKEKGRNRVC